MSGALATSLLVLGGLVLAIACGSVAFNAVAYLGATLDRRRRPAACPFDDDDVPVPWPARALSRGAAFTSECTATALLALSTPLAYRRPKMLPLARGDRPVVLVHGYAQHAANFTWLARRLRRDGRTHLHTVRHTPAWGDIERSANRLAAEIDRILRESGAPDVDLIAHSMGGLVARACIAARGGRGVARLVTLGTPHQGTEAFRWLGRDPMVAQMRPDSPLLRRLGRNDPVPALVECTSIYSTADALVVPAAHGYYPGAFNIEVQKLGHMSLLFSRRIYELVRESLTPVSSPAVVVRPRARPRA